MPVFDVITFSKHAERRMMKRRISRHEAELTLRIGTGFPEDDGTWIYELGQVRVVIVERGPAAHVVTVIQLRRHT